MAKIFVDGFTIKRNPSPIGGGYVIYKDKPKVYKIKKKGFTNNEAELLAVFHGVNIAEPYDEVVTDSKVASFWVLNGFAKARPDLNHICKATFWLLVKKKVKLKFVDRKFNLAGRWLEKKST